MSLVRQPLFRFLGALLVLFIVDYSPQWGAVALGIYLFWIGWEFFVVPSRGRQ